MNYRIDYQTIVLTPCVWYYYRYPALTIKYVRGKDPIIKLLDEDVVEELSIDKWNTDSVEEFLNTYIEYQGEEAVHEEESKSIP